MIETRFGVGKQTNGVIREPGTLVENTTRRGREGWRLCTKINDQVTGTCKKVDVFKRARGGEGHDDDNTGRCNLLDSKCTDWTQCQWYK